MTYIFVAIIAALAGFVIGALVYRNNATAANKVVTAAEGAGTAVASAATTVAADVEKA